MGLTPALAQTDAPMDESQTPPAMQQPAEPSELTPAQPSDPTDPAAPIPGEQSEMAPEDAPAMPGAELPAQSSEAAPEDVPSLTDSDEPAQSSEAAPEDVPALTDSDEPALSSEMAPEVIPAQPGGEASPPVQSSEAPKSIAPEDSAAAAPADSPQFLAKQENSDWLASDLIGKSVVNAENESIGDINDLITDENGKIVAVLIGAGGFLGLGEKDVAIRFEDLKLARDENDNVTAMVNLSEETLASAPDYETLSEQAVTIGASEPDQPAIPAQ
jgi:sporulation protein YlmC with PRC-barrel domain